LTDHQRLSKNNYLPDVPRHAGNIQMQSSGMARAEESSELPWTQRECSESDEGSKLQRPCVAHATNIFVPLPDRAADVRFMG
jgi:hypothetical protein